jgi:hypothetical protein
MSIITKGEGLTKKGKGATKKGKNHKSLGGKEEAKELMASGK